MTVYLEKITYDIIENSELIQKWLSQFDDDDRNSAIKLLLNLKFVSKESLNSYISTKINELYFSTHFVALYTVRKDIFDEDKNIRSLWDDNNEVIGRSGQASGSEDTIYSIINSLKRQNPNFLDNPSIEELREKKVRDIILLDDNISSGNRIKDFLKSFFMNKTIKSWWNYGFIRLFIVSFARNINAEMNILDCVPGTDNYKRKFHKKDKVIFYSWYVYDSNYPQFHWKESYDDIERFCKKTPSEYKLGYQKVMSNLVFEFSVPNTVPGILWAGSKNIKPLFPNRIPSEEFIALMQHRNLPEKRYLNEKLYALIQNIKSGVRNKKSLASRLNCELQELEYLLNGAMQKGFITDKRRLTFVGRKFLLDNKNLNNKNFDYVCGTYIPNSWCNEHSSVQPFVTTNTNVLARQTDLVSQETNGDSGQLSLERADADSPEANHSVASSSSHTESIMTSNTKIVDNLNNWCAEECSLHNLLEYSRAKYNSDLVLNNLREYAYNLKQKNVPVIFSLKHLALITKTPYKYLQQTVARRLEYSNYRLFGVTKRSGGRRWIHAVPSRLFFVQNFINKAILSKLKTSPCSFAFSKDGGIWKNAKMHCGAKWLFQFDLSDFFYNISEYDVYKIFKNIGYSSLLSLELARLCTTTKMPEEKSQYCFFKPRNEYSFYIDNHIGVLPQGASTSPMLSNLAAVDLDKNLLEYAQKYNFVYTRYADDITFSAINLPQKKSVRDIQRDIIQIIRKCHFRENPKKMRVAGPGAKKMVMGLLVDGEEPRISKETYRRIERLLYACEKFGTLETSRHEGFDSEYGFINHLRGLVAYVKCVDIERYKKFKNILDRCGKI